MRGVEAGRESALMIGRGCELSDGGRGGRCADDLAAPGTNETCEFTFHDQLIFPISKTIYGAYVTYYSWFHGSLLAYTYEKKNLFILFAWHTDNCYIFIICLCLDLTDLLFSDLFYLYMFYNFYFILFFLLSDLGLFKFIFLFFIVYLSIDVYLKKT